MKVEFCVQAQPKKLTLSDCAACSKEGSRGHVTFSAEFGVVVVWALAHFVWVLCGFCELQAWVGGL